MIPMSFPEATMVFGKDQPPYLPLPAFRDDEGQVITCWHLSWWERLCVLWHGAIWLRTLTFNQPLQPQLLEAHTPFQKVT